MSVKPQKRGFVAQFGFCSVNRRTEHETRKYFFLLPKMAIVYNVTGFFIKVFLVEN
jgi:hypothetical protein